MTMIITITVTAENPLIERVVTHKQGDIDDSQIACGECQPQQEQVEKTIIATAHTVIDP